MPELYADVEQEVFLALSPFEAAYLLRLISDHLTRWDENPFPRLTWNGVAGLALFLHDSCPQDLRTPVLPRGTRIHAA